MFLRGAQLSGLSNPKRIVLALSQYPYQDANETACGLKKRVVLAAAGLNPPCRWSGSTMGCWRGIPGSLMLSALLPETESCDCVLLMGGPSCPDATPQRAALCLSPNGALPVTVKEICKIHGVQTCYRNKDGDVAVPHRGKYLWYRFDPKLGTHVPTGVCTSVLGHVKRYRLI